MKLSDVVNILPAHPFRGSIEEVADGTARAVQMKDIEDDGAVAWHSLVRTELSGRREPNWLQPQDILFLVRGSRNIAVLLDSVPFPAVISPHFLLLRVAPGAGVLPAFVAWQMNQLPAQRYFEASAEGSVQRSIRKAVLADLPLVIPPKKHTARRCPPCRRSTAGSRDLQETHCQPRAGASRRGINDTQPESPLMR